jgi:hypothetical protein
VTDPTPLPPIPNAISRVHLHGLRHPFSVAVLRVVFRRRNPNRLDRAGPRFSTFGALVDWDSLVAEQSPLSAWERAVVRVVRGLVDLEQRCGVSPTGGDPKRGGPRP